MTPFSIDQTNESGKKQNPKDPKGRKNSNLTMIEE